MAENYKGYIIEKLGGRFQVTRGSDPTMIFHHIREAYAWVDSQAGEDKAPPVAAPAAVPARSRAKK